MIAVPFAPRTLRVIPLAGTAMLWPLAINPAPDILGRPNSTALRVHVTTALVIGLAATALSAWEAARSSREGVSELERASSRSAAAIVLRSVWPVLAVTWLTTLVLFAAAACRSYLTYPSLPSPWLVFLTLGLQVMQVALGAACGLLFGGVLGATCAVIVFYAAAFAGFYTGIPWCARLVPVIQETWDPVLAPHVTHLAVATGWCLLCSVAVICMVAHRRTPWWVRMVSVLAAFAVGAAAAAPRAAGELDFARPKGSSDPHRCVRLETGGSVCVYAEDDAALPPLTEVYRQAQSAVGDAAPFPPILAESGLATQKDAYQFTMLGRQVNQADIFDQLIRSALVRYADDCIILPSIKDPQGAEAPWEEIVIAVAAQRSARQMPLPAADHPVTHYLRRQSTADVNTWLKVAADRLSTCAAPPLPKGYGAA
ncbi:hypothetical protein KEM60_03061 [Austwickia sp. TVS 96-490-7B]|uniref:hypothetical protein n=1 Tax=Austwickia sp. TVS 96-490-7B TaxID=2830843 RepID=UPI001C586FCA|nr:hypothetical protein [Austwickia sp. TVS 96-490-7B]MBW3086832.1 hypothetical protein [Austwickia sp. TVS 96-490-7B]